MGISTVGYRQQDGKTNLQGVKPDPFAPSDFRFSWRWGIVGISTSSKMAIQMDLNKTYVSLA